MSPTPKAPPGANAPLREDDEMMYPGMMHWWRRHQRATQCESYADCGPRDAGPWSGSWSGYGYPRHEQHAAQGDSGELGGGSFGVRRPLRFLAYKLELDDE